MKLLKLTSFYYSCRIFIIIYLFIVVIERVVCIRESPSICPFLKNSGTGAESYYFSELDRYKDFVLHGLKIDLNKKT